MWCPNCQQDVPAIASGDEAACCARCGQVSEQVETATAQVEAISEMSEWGLELDASSSDSVAAVAETPAISDDWLLDEEFRRLQQRVGKNSAALQSASASGIAATENADYAGITPWNHSAPPPHAQSSAGAIVPQRRRHSMVAWMILSLGLMAFVCGGMLLGWSLLAGRNELWSLGMPMALAGQFGLLLGLVLQLDSLWQANRRTAETLDDVDHRLQEINHATTMLRTTHTGPAQSFYTHMAAGANPQMLLADLKGQLDLLAVKMAQR